MKTLSVRQFAGIKRVAQTVSPLVVKKNKIAMSINKLLTEFNNLNEEINGHEMGVKILTGGLTSEHLIVRKVEDTGKTDKEGKPIKITKYDYNPDTVRYNEETNTYELLVMLAENAPQNSQESQESQEPENTQGEEAFVEDTSEESEHESVPVGTVEAPFEKPSL